MSAKQEHKETLTLTYESDRNRADARAVGASLLALEAIIDEVQTALDENEKALVKARPFAQGSLELPIDLIVLGAGIIVQEYPLLVKIRQVIKAFFDIKGRLKGQRIQVEEGNVVIIENSPIHVDQITLQCLDPGSSASRKCAKAFHDIEEDSEIKSVRVSSSASPEPLIKVPRADFPYYHPDIPLGDQNLGQRHKETRETVIIRSPSFDSKLEWRLIWGKMKISAHLEDEDFQRRVEAREEFFAAGDTLDVDLRRVQRYDPGARTYVDKEFKITKVWGHERGPEQRALFK